VCAILEQCNVVEVAQQSLKNSQRLLLGGAFIYLGPRSELVYLSLRLVPQFFKVISLRLKRLELIEAIIWGVENKLRHEWKNERGKELTDSEKDQWSSFCLSSVVSTNIPNGWFKTCDEYVRIIKVGEGAKRYNGITLRSRQRSTDVERRNSENAHAPSKKKNFSFFRQLFWFYSILTRLIVRTACFWAKLNHKNGYKILFQNGELLVLMWKFELMRQLKRQLSARLFSHAVYRKVHGDCRRTFPLPGRRGHSRCSTRVACAVSFVRVCALLFYLLSYPSSKWATHKSSLTEGHFFY